MLCAAGCGSIPFRETQFISVESVNPIKARDEFAENLPSQFQVIDSIIFQNKWGGITAIGYTEVDTIDKEFTVVGLNPLGVKLFELIGDSDNVTRIFALKEFSRRGDIALAIANDIRRIYFDRIPPPEARIYKEKYKIIFRQDDPNGSLEHIFAGEDNRLIEKRYFRGEKNIWNVSYYEYHWNNGKLYPGGIILNHYQYRYKLIIQLKEVRS